ncbi:PAAR domain-containing protein [Neorhizobium sp. S3-V5DH]|uniref:PAAR domain-containing protein n=1 Tax=Neorhizobium sp. S3-V5DH TaxID=2485166 RepID=UPI0032AF1757
MVEPGPKPHVGGPISEAQTLVTVEGVPIAVLGDKCICLAGGPDTISSGSSIAKVRRLRASAIPRLMAVVS